VSLSARRELTRPEEMERRRRIRIRRLPLRRQGRKRRTTHRIGVLFAGPANANAKEDGIKEAQAKVAPAPAEVADDRSMERCQSGPGNVPNNCGTVGGVAGGGIGGIFGPVGAAAGGYIGSEAGAAICGSGKT